MDVKLPIVGNPPPDEPIEDLGMTEQELEDGIARLKKERNAVILAHYYQ